MGEISPLFVLLVVWWLFGLFTSGKRGQQQHQQRRTRAPADRPRPVSPPAPRPAAGPDATQREGSRLEQVMREFERALEEASQSRLPRRPEPTPEWEAEEEWHREGSVEEVEPEVRSLEDDFVRPERAVVVLGGDADELQRRRVAYAESRNRALTAADHRRFDERIRTPVPGEPDPEAPLAERTRRLRQAIIWREVLGPPVALRGEPGPR